MNAKTLTKAALAEQLERYLDVLNPGPSASQDIVENLLDLIVCHFQSGGEQVVIRGFGSFKRRGRSKRLVKAPTGRVVEVPSYSTIVFKPSAEVIRRINL